MFAQPSSRWPMPGANELSTEEWQSAQVMPTLVSCPASLTLPRTPTTAFSRNNSTVTAGLVEVNLTGAQRGDDLPRQSLDVDLEAHRQRGRRGNSRDDLVHPQHIGPQLFVAEGVVAEDGLPSRWLREPSRWLLACSTVRCLGRLWCVCRRARQRDGDRQRENEHDQAAPMSRMRDPSFRARERIPDAPI